MKITMWVRGFCRVCPPAAFFVIMVFGSKLCSAQLLGVLTWHNDNARTGQNLSETQLTPTTLLSGQFRKLCSYPVDGLVDAQPLYVPRVEVPRNGIRNITYVATEMDSVYAFDADCRQSEPLWKVSFLNPSKGVASDGEFGITGTPVIEPESHTIYLVAKTIEVRGNQHEYVLRLHALDIRDRG